MLNFELCYDGATTAALLAKSSAELQKIADQSISPTEINPVSEDTMVALVAIHGDQVRQSIQESLAMAVKYTQNLKEQWKALAKLELSLRAAGKSRQVSESEWTKISPGTKRELIEQRLSPEGAALMSDLACLRGQAGLLR